MNACPSWYLGGMLTFICGALVGMLAIEAARALSERRQEAERADAVARINAIASKALASRAKWMEANPRPQLATWKGAMEWAAELHERTPPHGT